MLYITIINSRFTEVSVKSSLRCFHLVYECGGAGCADGHGDDGSCDSYSRHHKHLSGARERVCQSKPEQHKLHCMQTFSSAAYQDVKRHEYGAGGQTDLSASRRKLPHQEDQESHVWDEQHHVPVTNPDGETETKSYEWDQNRALLLCHGVHETCLD